MEIKKSLAYKITQRILNKPKIFCDCKHPVGISNYVKKVTTVVCQTCGLVIESVKKEEKEEK